MPTRIHLADALNQITDSVVASCRGQLNGGHLDALTAVVSGRQARRRPDLPYGWVTVAEAAATHAQALHEQWTAEVMLSVWVKSEDPEDGWMDAMQLAAAMRTSVITDDRALGLEFVEDTQSGGLSVLGQQSSTRRFGASARLSTRFTLVEE